MNLPAEITVGERLNRFEIVQETIGFMMAMRTEAIHDEQQRPVPDAAKIEQWKQEFDRLDTGLDRLHLDDDAAVRRVLDEYCPVVKAEYERSRE